MCGIAGVVALDRSAIDAGLLADMNAAIAHRGPGNEGYVLIDRQSARLSAFVGADSPANVRAMLPSLGVSSQWRDRGADSVVWEEGIVRERGRIT